jgi:hypothetical protein
MTTLNVGLKLKTVIVVDIALCSLYLELAILQKS